MGTPQSPEFWDTRYSSRRVQYHSQEAFRLQYQDGDTQSLLQAIFKHRPDWLDPPSELTYVELKNYLGQGSLQRLSTHAPSHNTEDVILLDDRRHRSQRASSGRLENDEDHRGDRGLSQALSIRAYYDATRSERRHESSANAEKRTIFVASPSSSCLLALLANVAPRSAHILRDFLQNYLLFQGSFNVSCTDVNYVMEFHIPYFALRDGLQVEDKRALFGKPLRKSKPLPLARSGPNEGFTYHEAKMSCEIIGIDDFFWTSYYLDDCYFGSERMKSTYLSAINGEGLDPASGGARTLKFPFWNPREYFLKVLARRISQATWEWRNLILAFDCRMRVYTEDISCFDNAQLEYTQDLQPAVHTIQDLRSALAKTIRAWERFKRAHLHWFQAKDNERLTGSCRDACEDIERSITDLMSYQELLDDRFTEFDGILTRVMNASALQQNTLANQLQDLATKSGNYMRLLASITFFFLPCSLVVAMFSMTMVSQHTSILYPVIALVVVAIVAHQLALRPQLVRVMFPLRDV